MQSWGAGWGGRCRGLLSLRVDGWLVVDGWGGHVSRALEDAGCSVCAARLGGRAKSCVGMGGDGEVVGDRFACCKMIMGEAKGQ